MPPTFDLDLLAREAIRALAQRLIRQEGGGESTRGLTPDQLAAQGQLVCHFCGTTLVQKTCPMCSHE